VGQLASSLLCSLCSIVDIRKWWLVSWVIK
jgi:hypothetical protein